MAAPATSPAAELQRLLDGHFSSTRSKAVIKAVNAACAELAPHARVLVDAFGVPVASLGAARHVGV